MQTINVESAKYIRDLAERLLDYPTDNYKEAYDALIAYADELAPASQEAAAEDIKQLPDTQQKG